MGFIPHFKDNLASVCKCQLRNVQKWRNEIVQLWRFSFELCFDYHHHLQTRFYLLYDKIFQLF